MAASDIETEGDWHWRNSMRPLRFFALDARAGIPVFALILPTGSFRLTVFLVCLIVMFLFFVLERKGLTFAAAMRGLRAWIHGPKRNAHMWFKNRRTIDYGS